MSDSRDAGQPARGIASTWLWQAGCKDCAREQRDAASGKRGQRARGSQSAEFEYSAEWAARTLERGGSRSDRCSRHRKLHRDMIRSIAVPYVGLQTIGQVADPSNPTGPLGGLGPLPTTHTQTAARVDLQEFEFGLTDAEIVFLLEGLASKRVAVLEAGTGTGKSTFGPFRLANPPAGAPLRITDAGPIVVTEPRVPAASGCAAFVGETLHLGHDPRECTAHIGPGFPVGFQTAGNKNWDDACRLIYVTDGTMINWIRDGRLAHIGAVVVDEAHERSENIDLTLALLRDQLPRHPHLRVIITSATIDPSFFIAYFGGEDKVHHQVVQPTKQVGYGIPLFPGLDLDDTTLADGMEDGNSGRFQGFDDTLTVAPGLSVREHAKELLSLRPNAGLPPDSWRDQMPGAVARQALRVLQGTEGGDILCFLPNTDMITNAVGQIKKGLHGEKDVAVYPLLASTEDKIKALALAASRPGHRKVVVSSNLAETSLTVKGVRYVIDSGLISQSEWDPSIAQKTVPTKPHSQAGIRQRWGRVGRDAPGYVFPLYSLDDFNKLPRDTPPGSTRTNLEQFLIKLKASGVDDITQIALPASFAADGWTPDDNTKALATSFSQEVARAHASLVEAGAVDRHGHLTPMGHELGRANGPAEQAVAIMYADQLACVHEVALALAALQRGIVGPSSLLMFDTQWPAAWRIQANDCHRALAVGGSDDLDLILRIFNRWYVSDDRERWAREHWVNQNALLALLDEVTDQVAQLSPGMRTEAERAPDPLLATRARAVLSRAYSLHEYRPATDPVTGEVGWSKVHGPDTEVVRTDRYSLTEPQGRVIALRRQRVADEELPDTGVVVISGRVRLLPWAVDGNPDAFTLLERASVSAPPMSRSPIEATVEWLIDHAPVSCVIDVARGLSPLLGPTAYPGDLPDLTAESDEEAAPVTWSTSTPVVEAAPAADAPVRRKPRGRRTDSDREANATLPGLRLQRGDVPDEEASSAFINPELPAEPEAPVERLANAAAGKTPAASTFANIHFEWQNASGETIAPPHPGVGRVVGYAIREAASGAAEDAQVTIQCESVRHVEPLTLDESDLEWGADLHLRVSGFARDYLDEFRILEDSNGRKYFVHPRTRGLGGRDVGLSSLLEAGTDATWTVVPGRRRKDASTISPLPGLRRSVDAVRHRSPSGWLSAYFELDAESDGGTIYLQIPGLAFAATAIGVNRRLTRSLPQEAGLREVEVLLSADDGATLPLDRVRSSDQDLRHLVDGHRDFVRLEDGRLRATGKVPPRRTIDALLTLNTNPDWARLVWHFWHDSQRMTVTQIRLAGSQETVPAPPWVTSGPTASAVKALAQQWDVKCVVQDRTLHLSGDPQQVAAASQAIAATSAVRIDIPASRKGLVVGRQGSMLKQLRDLDGLIYVDLTQNTLVAVGRSRAHVARLVAQVRQLTDAVEGVLTLSNQTLIGRFIGRQGSTRDALLRNAGCSSARQKGDAPQFTISAPTQHALQLFLSGVRSSVDGGAQMTASQTQAVVVDLESGATWASEPVSQSPAPAYPQPPAQPHARAHSATPPPAAVYRPATAAPPAATPRPRAITVNGDSVEEAVAVGLRQLGLRRDRVQVQVIQEAERSLLLRRVKRQAKVMIIPL
jgi:HrpA-like RNA helicase